MFPTRGVFLMSLPHIVPQPDPIVYPDAEPGVDRCGRLVAGR